VVGQQVGLPLQRGRADVRRQQHFAAARPGLPPQRRHLARLAGPELGGRTRTHVIHTVVARVYAPGGYRVYAPGGYRVYAPGVYRVYAPGGYRVYAPGGYRVYAPGRYRVLAVQRHTKEYIGSKLKNPNAMRYAQLNIGKKNKNVLFKSNSSSFLPGVYWMLVVQHYKKEHVGNEKPKFHEICSTSCW